MEEDTEIIQELKSMKGLVIQKISLSFYKKDSPGNNLEDMRPQ